MNKKYFSGQHSFGSLATETSFESSIFVQHIKSHRRYKCAYLDCILFSVIALPAILSNYERRSLKILNFFSRDRHNFDSSEIPIDSLTL